MSQPSSAMGLPAAGVASIPIPLDPATATVATPPRRQDTAPLLLGTLLSGQDGPSWLNSAWQAGATVGEGAAELETTLALRPPRVLLVDVELCAEVGMEKLFHLRHLARGTQWVLAWPAPSHRWLDIVHVTQARGAIVHGALPCDVTRILDAVLAGEMWFPRGVLAALYASVLCTLSSEAPHGEKAHGDALHTLAALTGRQADVLALVREGLTNKQIAKRLDISPNTVKKHLANAFEKRGLKSRRQTLVNGA